MTCACFPLPLPPSLVLPPLLAQGVTSHGAPPGFAFRRHIPVEGRTALRLAGRVQFPSTVTLGGGGSAGLGPGLSGNAFKLFLDEVALRVCLP